MFKKYAPFIAIIAIISTFLIISWFRYGYLYGGGDVGLPSYNPLRILEIVKTLWWDATAPGTVISNTWTTVPVHIFQSFLQVIGLPSFIIQGSLFWLILFFMGVGMFFLGLEIFGKNKPKLALVASIFYLLNPYMMIEVWHRFIHNTFFLAVLLPWGFLFWSKWLRTGRYLYLLILILINFLCVYVYGAIAFIITVFLIFLFPTLFEIIIPWKGFKYSEFILKRAALGFIFFSLINIWWIYPLFKIAPAIISTQHTISGNLTSLISISHQAIIPFSLLGINPFYLFSEKDWGSIYTNPYMILAMGVSFLFLIPGFLRGLKNKNVIFYPLLFLIAILISKGVAPPFGYPFYFGSDNFFLLGLVRNPFEKLGIFIPFSQAIIFALGVEWYWDRFHTKKLRKKILFPFAVSFVIIFIISVWPMWTGQLFGKYDKLATVDIPQSYIDVNNFINSQQKTDGVILNLPLYTQEGVSYNWQHGYQGIDPSPLIFDKLPSVLHGFNLQHVDNSIMALSDIFTMEGEDASTKILNLLQGFSIRYIVLHKDVNWKEGDLENPDRINNILANLQFIDKKLETKELVLYQLKDAYYRPVLSLTNNIRYLDGGQIGSYWPLLPSEKKGVFLSSISDKQEEILLRESKQIISTPINTLVTYYQGRSVDTALVELPPVNVLPNSILYYLKRINEGLQGFLSLNYDSKRFMLTVAGKRLVEAYKFQKVPGSNINALLKDYRHIISSLDQKNIFMDEYFLKIISQPLSYIFKNHLALISEMKKNSNEASIKDILYTEDFLLNVLYKNNIIPKFSLDKSALEDNRSVNIYKYSLPKDDNYEILLDSKNAYQIYPDNLTKVSIYIDGKPKEFTGEIHKNLISYNNKNLSAGLHELGIEAIPSANLFQIDKSEAFGNVKRVDDGFELMTGNRDFSYVDLPINPLLQDSTYILSFEAWVKKGNYFTVQLAEDNDVWDPKIKDFNFNTIHNFSKDSYDNFWNKYTVLAKTRHSAANASFRILVRPWDDCRLFTKDYSKCDSESFRVQFQRPSDIVFRNFIMTRNLDNPLFLKSSTRDLPSSQPDQGLIFEKRSPTFYTGRINIKSPTFLIFSQSFDKDWQLKTFDGNNSMIQVKRYLADGFGNAWYIENPGNYSFELEFIPQKQMIKYILLSIIVFLVLIIVTITRELIDDK